MNRVCGSGFRGWRGLYEWRKIVIKQVVRGLGKMSGG